MPEFSGSADKMETFQVKSLILEAVWLAKEGAVGTTVGIQIRTLYVAHGAPIKVTVKNREGKTLETIQGVMYADLFRKQIVLGKDAAGGVFFEAELTKHSLKMTSPRLMVGLAIRLFDPSWKEDGKAVSKLRRGADLLIEVKTENIAEGSEARLFFKERVSPTLVKDMISVPCTIKDKKISLTWRFEYPQDTAPISSVADKKKTSETYNHPKVFFEAWSAGASVAGPEAEFIDGLTLKVVDARGESAPNRKVKITMPDGKTLEAETDANGQVFIEEAAPGQTHVELVPIKENLGGT